MSATSPFSANVRLSSTWHVLVPQRQPVVRNNPDPTVLPTNGPQEHIWVLPEGQGFLANLPTVQVMIRKEYDDLLVAILSSLERQQALRNNPSAPGPDRAEAFQLRITPRDPSLFNREPYPNPFALAQYRNLYHKNGALIITGLPGIGKTSFLALLFHLRVAKNLPTLYMETEDSAKIFKNGQLGELRNPTDVDLTENMPPETWCLVDSNSHLTTVPGSVQESKLFIVQATSPTAERMAYTKKRRCQFCLMAPWTLEELIAGSSLQDWPTTEPRIKTFWEKFGGSARNVFFHADDPDSFEHEIDAAAGNFDADDIERLITSTVSTLTVPGQVGHMLLSAFPLGDHDRREFQIRPPSDAMYDKVLKRISTSVDDARRRLYRICSGVDSPGCKAWVGHLFDQHYHDFLLAGGMWRLHVLQKPDGVQGQVITWTGLLQPSGSFLRAEKEMSIVDRTTNAPVRPATISRVLFDKQNEPKEGKALSKGVYYRPTQRTFATFDSLYVLKTNHVLAFQASVAKKHDVEKTDVEWLKERKVKKITYIYVTPSNYNGCPQVQVPVALEDSFDHFYHMKLG
ncbi:hypothetical protein B0H10DRAFT_777669 [Mycena sp. CBHHK59/15]|nr:hypothetical protein B0H10DRAFT_777669 [Mycena sp. CBHHK59/15]